MVSKLNSISKASKEKIENFKNKAKENDIISSLISREITKIEDIYTIKDGKSIEYWIYKDGIYVKNGDNYIQVLCEDLLGDSITPRIFRHILFKINSKTFINKSSFVNSYSKYEIAVQNGVLNIKTRELKPFTPKKIFFEKFNCEYNSKLDCPNIKNFLREVLGDDNDSFMAIQELLGYLLYRDFPIHKFFILDGYGRNGKGQFLDLVKMLIGHNNSSNLSMQQIEKDKFLRVDLIGKLANICGDLPAKDVEDTAVFKMLTGGDYLTIDQKHSSSVSLSFTGKMIFATNKFPSVKDNSQGFYDRVYIINFPFHFVDESDFNPQNLRHKKKIPKIIEKITTKEEMSGFLNFALEGFDRLMKKKSFTVNSLTKNSREVWKMKSDSLGSFIDSYIDVGVSNDFVLKSEFKKNYLDFCKKNSLNVCSEKEIRWKLLREFYCKEAQRSHREYNGRVRVWSGIRFKEKFIKSGDIVAIETDVLMKLCSEDY